MERRLCIIQVSILRGLISVFIVSFLTFLSEQSKTESSAYKIILKSQKFGQSLICIKKTVCSNCLSLVIGELALRFSPISTICLFSSSQIF